MLLDDYVLSQFIGKGTFGEVYLTKKKNTNGLFATKRMSKEYVEDPKYIKYFNNEISILKKLHHPHIVKLEDLKRTTNHYYVIMEYCNGGTLTECLEKYQNLNHRPFPEVIVQHIMIQIVSAVNYLHSQRVIHRDLKLDNILVKFENETDKNNLNLLKAEVKIIDFGFAATIDSSGLLHTAIGSPMNMDPLILHKFSSGGKGNTELGYDEKADIWSLGTLCYQLFTGNYTFNAYNMKELVSKIEEGTYKVPTNLSKEAISFLSAMLKYDPKKRLSADNLLHHPFLIKNPNNFEHINISQMPNKAYGGEFKMNIKDNNSIWPNLKNDNKNKVDTNPGQFITTQTPLSKSQYLENLNPNVKNQIISPQPINLEKNNIEKQFKPASSTIIPGLAFGNNTKNMETLPLYDKANNNKALNNFNSHKIIKTPMANNNLGQGPIDNKLVKGNNLITVERRLENGQIMTYQIPIEQYRKMQMMGGQNGQINKNPVIAPKVLNQPQLPQNNNIPIKQINPMPFGNQNEFKKIQPNMQIPQINLMQHSLTPQRVFNRISPQINRQNIQFQNGNELINKTLIQPARTNQIQQPKINNMTNAQPHLQPKPQMQINPQNRQIPQQQKSQINQKRASIQYKQPHGVPLNNINTRPQTQTQTQTQTQIQQKKAQVIPINQNKNLIQPMINNNQNKFKVMPQGSFNAPINQSIAQINQMQMMNLNQGQVAALKRLNTVNNVNNNLQNIPIRNAKTMTNQIQQNNFGFQNIKGQNIIGVQAQKIVGNAPEMKNVGMKAKLQPGQKTYVSIIK